MAEVPWPDQPMPCVLLWPQDADGEGYLHFVAPDGDYAVIPVTRGPTRNTQVRGPVWHVDDDGHEIATTSPSVHFVDHWHSPYTTRWRIISREPVGSQHELRAALDAARNRT